MKKIILSIYLLLTIFTSNAQTKLFTKDDDVRVYMENKWFSNPNGLKINYGYISELNTYGITVKNKHNAKFYYINVNINISYDGTYAKLNGMSGLDGTDLRFRVYKGKLVVAYGEPEDLIFSEE